MAAQNSNESVHHQVVVSLPSEPQKAHHHHDQMVMSQSSSSSQSQSPKTHELDKDDQTVRLVSQSKNPKSPRRSDAADDEEASAVQVDSTTSAAAIDTQEEESSILVEDTGRERLKRHRVEVAGRVWIPDLWGQEELLKDWTDCTAFDASLVNTSIMSARAALVQEGRRANSSGLRIVNRC